MSKLHIQLTDYPVAGTSTNRPGNRNVGNRPRGVTNHGRDDDKGIIYVDQAKGHDTFTGRASHVSTPHKGPKKTVHGGLSVVSPNDVIVIKSGNYRENLDIRGKNIKVIIEGNVRL